MPTHEHNIMCFVSCKKGARNSTYVPGFGWTKNVCGKLQTPGDFIAEEMKFEKSRERRGLPRKRSRAQDIAIGFARAARAGIVPPRCKYTHGWRCTKALNHKGSHKKPKNA